LAKTANLAKQAAYPGRGIDRRFRRPGLEDRSGPFDEKLPTRKGPFHVEFFNGIGDLRSMAQHDLTPVARSTFGYFFG